MKKKEKLVRFNAMVTPAQLRLLHRDEGIESGSEKIRKALKVVFDI